MTYTFKFWMGTVNQLPIVNVQYYAFLFDVLNFLPKMRQLMDVAHFGMQYLMC